MGKRCDVLLVEHDTSLREPLAQLLKSEGLTTLEVPSGEEALSLLRSGFAPEVMILDLTLPGMSGEQVLSAVRADATLHQPAFVVITAMPSPPALPVVAVLPKTTEVDTLLRILWPLVRGERYRPRA